jgi:hypothetical protein
MSLQRELIEQRRLVDPTITHHGRLSRAQTSESAPSHPFTRPFSTQSIESGPKLDAPNRTSQRQRSADRRRFEIIK